MLEMTRKRIVGLLSISRNTVQLSSKNETTRPRYKYGFDKHISSRLIKHVRAALIRRCFRSKDRNLHVGETAKRWKGLDLYSFRETNAWVLSVSLEFSSSLWYWQNRICTT